MAFSLSKSSRFATGPKSDVPGPGEYSQEVSWETNAPSLGYGDRFKEHQSEGPAPGSYHPDYVDGRQIALPKPASRAVLDDVGRLREEMKKLRMDLKSQKERYDTLDKEIVIKTKELEKQGSRFIETQTKLKQALQDKSTVETEKAMALLREKEERARAAKIEREADSILEAERKKCGAKVTELRDEVATRQRLLDDHTVTLHRLQACNADLTLQIQSFHRQLEDINTEKNDILTELKKNDESLYYERQLTEKLTGEAQSSAERSSALKSRLLMLDEEKQQMEHAWRCAIQASHLLENQLTTERSKFVILEASSIQSIAELNDRILFLEHEMEVMAADKARFENDAHELYVRRQSLENTCDTLRREKLTLANQYADLAVQKQVLEERMTQSDETVTDLAGRLRATMYALEEAEGELTSAKVRLRDMASLRAEKERLIQDFTDVRLQLQEAKAANGRLEETIVTFEETKASLGVMISQLEGTVFTLESDVTRERHMASSMAFSLSHLQNQFQALCLDMERMDTSNKVQTLHLISEVASTTEKLVSLEAMCRDKEGEIVRVREGLAGKETLVRQMEQEIQTLTQELNAAANVALNREQALLLEAQTMRKINDAKDTSLLILTSEVTTLRSQISDLEIMVTALKESEMILTSRGQASLLDIEGARREIHDLSLIIHSKERALVKKGKDIEKLLGMRAMAAERADGVEKVLAERDAQLVIVRRELSDRDATLEAMQQLVAVAEAEVVTQRQVYEGCVERLRAVEASAIKAKQRSRDMENIVDNFESRLGAMNDELQLTQEQLHLAKVRPEMQEMAVGMTPNNSRFLQTNALQHDLVVANTTIATLTLQQAAWKEEKRLLDARIQALEEENFDLVVEAGKLGSHKNLKQKIHFHAKVKEENFKLKKEVETLREQLLHYQSKLPDRPPAIASRATFIAMRDKENKENGDTASVKSFGSPLLMR